MNDRRAGLARKAMRLEELEPRVVLSASITSVVNSLTGASTGSLAGSAGSKTVTITGTGFTGAINVLFGAAGASYTVVNDTTITASYPAAQAGSVNVVVQDSTNNPSNPVPFDYMAPVITNVSPNSGPIGGGTNITITGQYFTGAAAVLFGTMGALNPTVVNDTTITATSPNAGTAQIVDMRVTVNGTQSAITANDQFSFVAPPVVASLSPPTGPNAGGTSVIITGTGFTGATAVKFGNTPVASFQVNGDGTQITTTSPAGTGTVDVTIVTPNGTTAITAGGQFRYATLPLYINVPQDAAVQGAYLTMYGVLEQNYTNTFGTVINSGTNVYLVSTGTGYDYVPLSTLGNLKSIPPFLSTNTALTNYAVQIPNLLVSANRVVIGVGAVTTIAAASNNQTLPQSTINVASTAGFATAGTIQILTKEGAVTNVSYTATTPTSFTGATGGTGTLATNAAVRGPALLTTVSGNQTIPSAGGTLTVGSTAGFASSGALALATNSGIVNVIYLSKTATTFTISPVSQDITLYSGNTVSSVALPTPKTDNGGGVAAPTPGSEGNNIYDFFEFTYIPDPATQIINMTINTSAIDQFGLPLTLNVQGGSVSPLNEVGVQLTREQILGVLPNQGLFAQFVAGTAFSELIKDGFGNPTTARIISPGDQLTSNTVQNVIATPNGTGTMTAGTYYYAVTAVSNAGESTVSQLGLATLTATGGVSLNWTVSLNPAVTGYKIYRGVPNGQSLSWSLIDTVANPVYQDIGNAGTPQPSGIPIDPLSTYFNQAISTLFSQYTASNPLVLTVTDGSSPPNGLQYTFHGVAEQEPSWVTTVAGATPTPRTVLTFTCVSIENNSGGAIPLIPIGSKFFVYQPFFNSNSGNLSLPNAPAWNGTPFPPYNFIPSAQAFAANGVFADNTVQSAALYNNPNQPAGLTQNAYSVALGAIENKINAALLRGIVNSVNSVNWANAPTKLAAKTGASSGTLDNQTTYYYVVTTLNAAGESTVSNEVNFKPTNGSVLLTWTTVPGATGYKIYRGTSSGGENILVGTLSGQNTTTFNDTQLTPALPAGQPPATGSMTAPTVTQATPSAGGSLTIGQAYYYKVTAIGVTGESVGSNEMSATPTGSQRSVTLAWNAVANAAAYKIYRGTAAGQENVLVGTIPGLGTAFTDAGGNNQNPPPIMYYAPGSISDLYAQFFHQTYVSLGGLAYADPFDDQGDQSSTVAAVSPWSVTLNMGHWGTVITQSTDQFQGGNTLVIDGAGFDLVAANNTVTLSSGAGSVTQVNATGTQLVYTFTTQPSLGTLTASVKTAFGGNSGAPVQVADVTMSDFLRPTAQIVTAPALNTASTGATFTFTATAPNTPPNQFTFEVSLDGGAFTPVVGTTVNYSGLALGSHTFQVRAINPVNSSISDPVSYTWIIAQVSQLQILSGAGQSGLVGQPFNHPIVVRVVDQSGNPVSDATVSFVVTPAFTGAAATIVSGISDRAGLVVATPVANATPGSYQVQAVSGSVTSSTFSLSNTSYPSIASGAPSGALPRVDVRNIDGTLRGSFLAYSPRFRGGVRVATGDINSDGIDDVLIAPMRAGSSLVQVVDGTKVNMVLSNGQIDPRALLGSFYAYAPRYTGGVVVSTIDFNGDGRLDVLVSPAAGRLRPITVVDGPRLMAVGKYPIRYGSTSLPVIATFPGYANRFATAAAKVKASVRLRHS